MSIYWRAIWFDADDSGRANWWPSHEDFADEESAHRFALETSTRIGGEVEVRQLGGAG